MSSINKLKEYSVKYVLAIHEISTKINDKECKKLLTVYDEILKPVMDDLLKTIGSKLDSNDKRFKLLIIRYHLSVSEVMNITSKKIRFLMKRGTKKKKINKKKKTKNKNQIGGNYKSILFVYISALMSLITLIAGIWEISHMLGINNMGELRLDASPVVEGDSKAMVLVDDEQIILNQDTLIKEYINNADFTISFPDLMSAIVPIGAQAKILDDFNEKLKGFNGYANTALSDLQKEVIELGKKEIDGIIKEADKGLNMDPFTHGGLFNIVSLYTNWGEKTVHEMKRLKDISLHRGEILLEDFTHKKKQTIKESLFKLTTDVEMNLHRFVNSINFIRMGTTGLTVTIPIILRRWFRDNGGIEPIPAQIVGRKKKKSKKKKSKKSKGN